MPELSCIEALRETLNELLTENPNIILLGADIGKRGGIFLATQNLLQKFGAQRVIDTPPSASLIIGCGIGAALYGFLPICEIQYADFIYGGLNQLINEASKIHYRSKGQWNLPIVIRVPYGGGSGGGLYHSQSIEALLAHIPGLKIVVPSNPCDFKGLLISAVKDPNPVIFLEPRQIYYDVQENLPEESFSVPIGKACITHPGNDLSVFTYGAMHEYTLQAAKLLENENIFAEVIDLRTLAPLDYETILQSIRKTSKALIVHEDTCTSGYGAEIAAWISENCFFDLDAPIQRLCAPDVPAVPFSPPLQEWFMPSSEKIAQAIRELAACERK